MPMVQLDKNVHFESNKSFTNKKNSINAIFIKFLRVQGFENVQFEINIYKFFKNLDYMQFLWNL